MSLANEGRRMLQALLNELKLNKQIEIVLLLDRRFNNLDMPDACEIAWVNHSDFWLYLDETMSRCDAVLPIAPEQDGLLAMIAARVLANNKQLWLSDPDTIALCSNKLQTIKLLAQYGLPVVETWRLADYKFLGNGPWVIKPNDGMGCQGSLLIKTEQMTEQHDAHDLIVQAYIEGDSLSLSSVFIDGQGYLLSCNRQQINIKQNTFELLGCSVNIEHSLRYEFEEMIQKVATAMPKLWGYIGIDLIVSSQHGPMILEINPRITTSYVGLYEATGISPYLQLHHLLNGEHADFVPKWNAIAELSL